jgi:hypothetical protein
MPSEFVFVPSDGQANDAVLAMWRANLGKPQWAPYVTCLADELQATITGVTYAPVIYALSRSAAMLNTLAVRGVAAPDILAVLGVTAAELERRSQA